MRRVLMLWLVAAAAPAVGAELESNVDQPYRLTVCLHFADDPVFTRFFQGSLRGQVQDQLVNYFGRLVELRVVTEHPLLAGIETAGLDGLTISPDQFDPEILPDKVFLATFDFQAGLYRIGWRQWDGEVQRMGPLGQQSTPDRQWLAKAICLAVAEGFAPVARVEPIEGTGRVRLQFRGANRNSSLAAYLPEGCVLQPFWVIRQRSGALARVPIPYTVLRIDDGETPDQAAVVSSLADPWRRTARVAGFQAIKISTRSGRFRLKLVDARSGSPVQNCQVYANSTGFGELADGDRLEQPDRDGYVLAPRPFEHLAFIKIAQSGGSVSQILLPITDDWCEQVCRLQVDRRGGEKSRWQQQVTVLVQDVQVLQNMLDQFVRHLNDLNAEKQYEQAVKQVREAIASLEPLLKAARDDVADLRGRAGRLDLTADKRLQWTGTQVEELGGRIAGLREMDRKLEQTIQDTVARNLASVQARLAEDLIKQGDIEEAIGAYREAVRMAPQPALQTRLEALEQTWAIKDEEHRKARTFVFHVWPPTRIRKLEDSLPEAERAFKKLQEVDDYLTARALLKGTGDHLRDLADLVDMLSQRESEEDRTACRGYMELTEKTARFQLDVGAYLKERLPDPAAAGVPKVEADRRRGAKPPESK